MSEEKPRLASELISELQRYVDRKGDHGVVNCLGEPLVEVDWDEDESGEAFVLGFRNDDAY